ncbi:hypothetical protein [Oikeobacillus pervagus]|nr:hypothetical protein [Oikeobacillus pervagus]
MTRIPTNDRDLLEKAIYLPMLLIILNRDYTLIKNSPFKLPKPYLTWLSETMKAVQHDLAHVKTLMRKRRMKVEKLDSDDSFTMYLFHYKGYVEQHNYFNPRLRNKVEELLRFYLYERFQLPTNGEKTRQKK